MSEPRHNPSHNPSDPWCRKRVLGERSSSNAKCEVCRPVVRQPASEPASDFELWSRVDVGPGAYQWMVWCVGAMDATWFRTEADARAALTAARGKTQEA